MAIEADVADFLAGVRHGRTIGAPVVVAVWNRDFADWQPDLAAFEAPGQEPTRPAVRRPRPGHADLAGAQKTGAHDLRDVLERASARETAARVAAGALARQLLAAFGVRVRSQVLAIGGARAAAADLADDDAWAAVEASDVRCADEGAAAAMREAVDAAREAGDSLGGVGGAVALGVPPGLGGYESWEARLDGRLAAAAMSVPSVKAVELGDGWASAGRPGSAVHDEIVNDHSCPWGLRRRSNRAGGVEGGVSNGEAVVVRAAFKPIPTLTRPLSSVDLDTGQAAAAHAERSDVCIVPAGCVVLEAMVALVLADALVEKLGGDCMADMLAAHGAYLARLGGAFGCDA
jgi:chorismate synthase